MKIFSNWLNVGEALHGSSIAANIVQQSVEVYGAIVQLRYRLRCARIVGLHTENCCLCRNV